MPQISYIFSLPQMMQLVQKHLKDWPQDCDCGNTIYNSVGDSKINSVFAA